MEMELWSIFGNYEICSEAPAHLVDRVTQMVKARRQVEYEQQKKQEEEIEDKKKAADGKVRAQAAFRGE